MDIRFTTRGAAFGLVVSLVLSLVLILVLDWSINSVAEAVRLSRLEQHSEEGLADLSIQLADLRADSSRLVEQINERKNRSLPDLHALNDLSRRHRLSVDRIERVNSSNGKQICYANLTGRITNVVGLLETLDSEFVFLAERVIVVPSSPDGSRVTLGITLELSE